MQFNRKNSWLTFLSKIVYSIRLDVVFLFYFYLFFLQIIDR